MNASRVAILLSRETGSGIRLQDLLCDRQLFLEPVIGLVTEQPTTRLIGPVGENAESPPQLAGLRR